MNTRQQIQYILNFVTAVFENFKIGSYFKDPYFKSKIRTLKVRTVLYSKISLPEIGLHIKSLTNFFTVPPGIQRDV